VQTLVQLGDGGSSIRCLTLQAEWLPITASALAEEATATPGRLIKIDTARLAWTLGTLCERNLAPECCPQRQSKPVASVS
jgi:hypothetical protein